MSDSVVDEALEELEKVPDVDLANWVRQNYNDLCALCERHNIPRPPPW